MLKKAHRFASVFMLVSLIILGGTIYLVKSYIDSPKRNSSSKVTDFNFSKIQRMQKKQDVAKVKKEQQKMKKKMKELKPVLSAQFQGPSFGLNMDELSASSLDKDLLAADDNVIMDENSVDQKPKILTRPAIEFPDKAIKENILKGLVEVRMLIDKNGNVTKTEILESNPKGYFEEVTLAMLQDWRFQPASYQGKNVAIWAKQVVKFGE